MAPRKTLPPATAKVEPTTAPEKSPRTRAPRAPRKRSTAKQTGHSEPKIRYGPTETAVRADLARMDLPPDQPSQALAQVAIHLAASLDAGAGLSTAAVARELRATLAALTTTKEPDDEDDPLANLIAALSSPVVDASH